MNVVNRVSEKKKIVPGQSPGGGGRGTQYTGIRQSKGLCACLSSGVRVFS